MLTLSSVCLVLAIMVWPTTGAPATPMAHRLESLRVIARRHGGRPGRPASAAERRDREALTFTRSAAAAARAGLSADDCARAGRRAVEATRAGAVQPGRPAPRGSSSSEAVDLAPTVAQAAWRISEQTGASLADGLDVAADLMTARHDDARRVREVTAGARATIRLLTVLPLAGLVGGPLLGVTPAQLTTAPLAGCVALGLALLVGGRVWVAALVRRATREVLA